MLVLSVCLKSVYAVFGVNSWSWQGDIDSDDKTLCSAMTVELWTGKSAMRDEDEYDADDMSRYEKSRVWPARLGCEDLVVVSSHARSRLLPAVSGMVNWLSQEILWSPSFSWWFPPSPLIPLLLVLKSNITQVHKVKLSLSLSRCHDQELTLSTAYTEYSIHWEQHTPSTAYTQYCIHRVLTHPKIDCLPLPASLSSLGRPCCTQFSTFPQLQVNQWIQSQLPSRLPPELPPAESTPPSTPPISLDHALQVHHQTGLITACRCISNLAWLRPQSSHLHGLQFHISIPARLRPSTSSPNSHDHGLQVYLQICSIAAPKFARSRPLISHNRSPAMHPLVYSITLWWNGAATWHTAHHHHSAAPRMVSEGNSWESAVLAQWS